MDIKLFNHPLVIVVVIDRHIRTTCTESWVYCPHASDTRYSYTYILCPKQSHVFTSRWTFLPVNWPNVKLSYLFLLPWCTSIAGYQINSNNSNHQQQPTTHYRQRSNHYDESAPTSIKPLCLLSYTWAMIQSVAISLAFISVGRQSHEICCNPLELYEEHLVDYMLIIWWYICCQSFLTYATISVWVTYKTRQLHT